MIELNILYALTSPAGTITNEGIEQVLQFIQAQRLTADDWKAQNPDCGTVYLPALPEDWQWVWTVTGRGEYVGTLPKRISKYYYKQHGIRCPATFLQQLGNIARAHTTDNLRYNFEFVTEFDWEAGDFGDSGSCFWGGRAEARRMLAENGAYAVRFYNDEGNGIARAWVFPAEPTLAVIFNGYGFAGSSTLVIARVVALQFGWTYKKIRVHNNGVTGGTMWINGESGYAVGAPEKVNALTAFDLSFGERYICESCGDPVTEDDRYLGADDEWYCQQCFYNTFDNCAICGEVFWYEDLHYVCDEHVCDRCLDAHYTYCARCEEYYHNSYCRELDREWYCERCYEDLKEDE